MKQRQSWLVMLLVLSVGLAATTAYGVKAGRLWLPKKYQHAMVKLENTAYLAGATPRCIEVIAGKIDHSKSTADNFHFVITCRDDNRRSFNMVYDYAVNANAPVLVLEQKRPEPEPELLEEESVPSMTGDEAWLLCIERLQQKTTKMIDVLYMDENPTPGLVDQSVYSFSIPLEAKNPNGERLRYSGLCKVFSGDGATTLKIAPR